MNEQGDANDTKSTPPANPIGGEPLPPPRRPRILSINLVAAEETPQSLKSDSSGKMERKSWSKLGLWLAGLPTKENVDLFGKITDICLRLVMSAAFLGMAWWWLWIVGGVVRLQTTEHHLSDGVLIALLTTTTINVLGLLYFVANYLFPKLKTDKDGGIPKPPSMTDS